MRESPPRIYVDTSVFGGAFDEEFEEASWQLFNAFRTGQFQPVISDVVAREVAVAPKAVRKLYQEILRLTEVTAVGEDALELRDAYQAAGILSRKWSDDALHVALASVSQCAMIVSWNFKHIVHFQKIPLYNSVNKMRGYGELQICSPLEVIGHGNQDKDI